MRTYEVLRISTKNRSVYILLNDTVRVAIIFVSFASHKTRDLNIKFFAIVFIRQQKVGHLDRVGNVRIERNVKANAREIRRGTKNSQSLWCFLSGLQPTN